MLGHHSRARHGCFDDKPFPGPLDFLFFFYFFLFPESGSLLQLIFDGKYEAIFSNSAIRNVFSASSVSEENIESYLEKQILTYLDCSTEVDNVERWKSLFIIWKINRGNVWFSKRHYLFCSMCHRASKVLDLREKYKIDFSSCSSHFPGASVHYQCFFHWIVLWYEGLLKTLALFMVTTSEAAGIKKPRNVNSCCCVSWNSLLTVFSATLCYINVDTWSTM